MDREIIKKTLIMLPIFFLLSSCSLIDNLFPENENPYKDITPFVQVEEEKDFVVTKIEYGNDSYDSYIVDITFDDFTSKIDQGESFVYYTHMVGCGYCKTSIVKHINPYIKDIKNKIYGFHYGKNREDDKSFEETMLEKYNYDLISENTKSGFPCLFIFNQGKLEVIEENPNYFIACLNAFIYH